MHNLCPPEDVLEVPLLKNLYLQRYNFATDNMKGSQKSEGLQVYISFDYIVMMMDGQICFIRRDQPTILGFLLVSHFKCDLKNQMELHSYQQRWSMILFLSNTYGKMRR